MLGNAQVWTTRAIEDVNHARVAALLDDDLSVRDIAEETGLSKSVVGRLKKAIEAEKGNPK
jgi:putative DNA primase/helicase